jgi:hypothetical protein
MGTVPWSTRLSAAVDATRFPRLLEAIVAAALLGLLTVGVYGQHVIHGGFLSDAWNIRGMYEFAPKGGLIGGIEAFLDQRHVTPRPLLAIDLAGRNVLFGEHMGAWLAWQAAQAALMASVLFALLRELRIPRLDALSIAALVVVFPAASTVRLWIVPSDLTIILALLGFLTALRAFGAEGRRALAMHGLSLALFVASLALYEIVLLPMLASVLLYRLRVSWRTAARRWLVDCAVLIPVTLALKSAGGSAYPRQDGLADMWRHVEITFEEAQALFTSVVLPFDTTAWQVWALVALIPATAILVRRGLPASDPARAQLTRWLVALAAGLAVVMLGYGIFIPAVDFYAPASPGLGTRVNAVPSIGWTLLLYGIVRLAATMAFRGLPDGWRLSAGACAVACLVIGASWTVSIERDARDYQRAYAEGQEVISAITAAVADPPPDATIWAFGQPVEAAPGIPVFADTWDLRYRTKLAYDDPTIVGYVGYEGTTFSCRPHEIVPGGHGQYLYHDPWWVGSFASAYGRTYFVDTTTGRSELIETPAQCRKAARSFPRSPQFAPA